MPSTSKSQAVQLLSPGEAAALLYVHPRTVTRWANAGKLSAVVTPGGHRRFALADVLRLMVDPRAEEGDGPADAGPARAQDAADEVARHRRRVAGQEADELVADAAARNAVATRVRAEAAAARVSGAAELAAASERALAAPGDAHAELRAARIAATVEAAAVHVAATAAALAEAVAAEVATTADLVSTKRLDVERSIEAEITATLDDRTAPPPTG